MELKGKKGFTLIEMIVVVAIIGTLAGIAIPGFMKMAPGMRLKSAARDIVSNIQLSKAQALRDRKPYTIQFNPAGSTYTISNSDGIQKTVNLSEYKGVSFGSGFGKTSNDTGPDDESDGITFASNAITFNADSTANTGGVYLKNEDNNTYSVICISVAGGVKTLKNRDGSGWE